MKIVFMGTPAFAVPSLQMLMDEGYEVVAVVTQPDRPQGRKKSWLLHQLKKLHYLSVYLCSSLNGCANLRLSQS